MRLQFNSKLPFLHAQHAAAGVVFLNRSLAITVPGMKAKKKARDREPFF